MNEYLKKLSTRDKILLVGILIIAMVIIAILINENRGPVEQTTDEPTIEVIEEETLHESSDEAPPQED